MYTGKSQFHRIDKAWDQTRSFSINYSAQFQQLAASACTINTKWLLTFPQRKRPSRRSFEREPWRAISFQNKHPCVTRATNVVRPCLFAKTWLVWKRPTGRHLGTRGPKLSWYCQRTFMPCSEESFVLWLCFIYFNNFAKGEGKWYASATSPRGKPLKMSEISVQKCGVIPERNKVCPVHLLKS